MNRLLSDISIEIFRAVISGIIFFHLIIIGKRNSLHKQPGWLFILAGFGLLFFGTLIDITDNFPALNQYIIIGDTEFEAFLEKVAGYTLGSLLLAVGFWKWLPAILALRETKEKLDRNEKYFRSLIENSFDIITVLDREGAILFQTPSFTRIFGYNNEEVIGKNIFEYIYPEDRETVLRAFQATIQQPGSYQHQDLRFLHKDGTWRFTEAIGKYTPLHSPGWVIVNSRDVTDRKRAEQTLKESETTHRIVADNTHDWEFWLDPEGRFIYTSPSCKRTTGHTREEFMTDPALLDRIIHPEDKAQFDAHRHEAMREKQPNEIQFRIVRPDKGLRWIDHVCLPVFDEEGKFLGARGSNRDITRTMQAKEEREKLIEELKDALANVKTLSGMLPICASCKKIRDDKGYWNQVEVYVRDHSNAEFSHGLCPECVKKTREEYDKWKGK